MNRRLFSGLAIAIMSIGMIVIVFATIQLSLFLIASALAVPYISARAPDWNAGPLGGAQILPLFIVVLPFSIWLTAMIWKRTRRWLSNKYETVRKTQFIMNVVLALLAIGGLYVGVSVAVGVYEAYRFHPTISH